MDEFKKKYLKNEIRKQKGGEKDMNVGLIKEGLDLIGGIFRPLRDVVDDFHLSGEEEGEIKIKLAKLNIELEKLQAGVTNKVLELESKIVEAQQKILSMEISSGNWLQKGWRPFSMACFTALIIADNLTILSQPLSPHVYEFYKIGMTGYIAGRSLEKIAKTGSGSIAKAGIDKAKGLFQWNK